MIVAAAVHHLLPEVVAIPAEAVAAAVHLIVAVVAVEAVAVAEVEDKT